MHLASSIWGCVPDSVVPLQSESLTQHGCLQRVGEGWKRALDQLHTCTCVWANTSSTEVYVTDLPEVSWRMHHLISVLPCDDITGLHSQAAEGFLWQPWER